MTAATSSRRPGRPSTLDRVCEFVEIRDGARIYRCRECQRLMQTDNRKGSARPLSGVLRHDKAGRCASCVDSIRRTGKPIPVGGPKGAGKPTADELPDRSGLCECGCGQRTAVAKRTIRAEGKYRGVPNRFLSGHAAPRRHRRDVVTAEPVAETEQQWKARAACRADQVDPRAFELPDGWRGAGPTPEAQLAARRWCAQCPVIAECADLAEQLNESAAWPVVGLWGGEWRSHAGITPIRTATPIRTPEPASAGSAA